MKLLHKPSVKLNIKASLLTQWLAHVPRDLGVRILKPTYILGLRDANVDYRHKVMLLPAAASGNESNAEDKFYHLHKCDDHC